MSEALSESSRHLATLDRAHRRAAGVVYTPGPIVELVLDQEFGSNEGPAGPVLDPACGTGVFVLAVIARIAEAVDRLEGRGTPSGRRHFLHEVERLVWACDVDREAVRVTLAEVRALVESLAPGPLSADFLAGNIVVADFLSTPCWAVEGGFRHVVGNPPYVPIERIALADRARYRREFSCAQGRTDLYHLFMERSAEVLGTGGSWSLITPDKFLTGDSGRALRELLVARGAIRTLTRFSSHSVFDGASTVPCITTWVKGGVDDAEQLRVECEPHALPVVRRETGVPRAAFQDSSWSFHSASIDSLLTAIAGGHPTLADCTDRISAGPATGLNDAFIVDARTAATLDEELVHPTVRGRDIGRFVINDVGSFMIVPYAFAADGSPSLVDLADYPRTRRWLMRHRTRLTARHAVRAWGKSWWDLHDPITLPLHVRAKLLVPDVARRNRFAVDRGHFVPQHSAYYLLPREIDADVLAAVLNSEPVELLIRSKAPLVKDGFSRYRRRYLLDLPVPAPTAALSREIRAAVRAGEPERGAELAAGLFDVDLGDVRAALTAMDR